ncbi:hypothetical protein RZN22_08605 [Bacillaceae bacterium S4-13-58]
MEEFIQFIFNNIFLIVIVLGAILTRLGKRDKKETSQSQRPNRPIQKTGPSPSQRTPQRPIQRPTVAQQQSKMKNERPVSNSSTDLDSEKQRIQEQKGRLEHANSIAASKKSEERNGIQPVTIKELRNKKEITISVNEQLNPKGLVEGIIMAEVIGAPRSMKPHLTRRNKK